MRNDETTLNDFKQRKRKIKLKQQYCEQYRKLQAQIDDVQVKMALLQMLQYDLELFQNQKVNG